MISATPYRGIIDRNRIVNRWITSRVRIRIGIRIRIGRIIKRYTDVNRPAIITEPKIKTRLKIPIVVRIEINITRMIGRRQVNMIDDYLLIRILRFIVNLTVFVAVLIVSIINRFIAYITKTGITTGQSNQQYQKDQSI